MKDFLPVCRDDMRRRGWTQPDFVYVIGDAYVDHSSFGPAIISRVLEAHGYKVCIISQPDWHDPESIAVFGRPRLGFLVSAGNMDSMVNHYTVNKKRRSTDAYTPGGEAGRRPDYATVVYCNLIKRQFKDVPVIIGGIEASLRRLAHYDYWSGKLRRSILLDSGADLLMYGMGELATVELADALDGGLPVSEITWIRGTVFKCREPNDEQAIRLPDYDDMLADKLLYARSFGIQYRNTDPFQASALIEKYGENRYVVQNPPQRPLTSAELDAVYELPYMNDYHPSYRAKGGVSAINEIKFSLTSCRGCFGACSFCALTFHQGRIVQARSRASLVREARAMTLDPDFKGNIHDVGGPTANFRRPACDKQMTKGACAGRQCLFPTPCPNLKADHSDYIALLRELRGLPGVKHVFIRSGIRFDYLLADKKSDAFLRELCRYHVSGQLRVAPEHVSNHVLDLMGKPRNEVYQRFCHDYQRINRETGKEQYIVPYLISSHPGSRLDDAIALAESVRDMGYMPEQVQDFYPTPSTISTVMFYTGVDPRTMQKVYVPSSPREKAMQRALIQYRLPENYDLVKEALIKCGREDLIGTSRHCLIPPEKPGSYHRAEAHAAPRRSDRPEQRSVSRRGERTDSRGVSRGEDRSQTRNTDRRAPAGQRHGGKPDAAPRHGHGRSGADKGRR